MEYILNKTPIRTSNNFKVNDFKVDLDIKETPFNDFNINNDKVIVKKQNRSNFASKIGLTSDKYLNLDIKSDENQSKPVFITYEFDDNCYLTSQINLTIEKNIKTDFIIVFKSKKYAFLNTKIVINLKEKSNSNISVINILSPESESFIAVENIVEKESESTVNLIDLGGKIKVSNYYSVIDGERGKNYFNSLYYGEENQRLDLNYYIGNKGKNTVSNIKVEGALNDNSYKCFKGTIDFFEGSTKSIGEENENCILLSDESVSKSLPMLLCHEEDVVGAHGVSTGKIDEDKLFYLMSRGISENEAKKLIIDANYNLVIENIPDEDVKDMLRKKIDELL